MQLVQPVKFPLTRRRQRTGRRLADIDHEELIRALNVLHSQSLIDFNDAVMETMSRSQQVRFRPS
jgi:hypothetical protein